VTKLEELPDLLTVEEAAAVLRIGRSLAYQLARRWVTSNGTEGLPVILAGRCMRVVKHQLGEIVRGERTLTASVPPPAVARKPSSRSGRRTRPVNQLRLLDPDTRRPG
jgi:hypothetical protein